MAKLGEIMETKRLEDLEQCPNLSDFMLSPFRQVLQEYCTLLLKMALNSHVIPSIASNLEHLINVKSFLNLVFIVPLLNDFLAMQWFFFNKLAQAHDIFIINSVQAIKLIQVVFNEMFLDPSLLLLYFIRSYLFNLLWKICIGQFWWNGLQISIVTLIS